MNRIAFLIIGVLCIGIQLNAQELQVVIEPKNIMCQEYGRLEFDLIYINRSDDTVVTFYSYEGEIYQTRIFNLFGENGTLVQYRGGRGVLAPWPIAILPGDTIRTTAHISGYGDILVGFRHPALKPGAYELKMMISYFLKPKMIEKTVLASSIFEVNRATVRESELLSTISKLYEVKNKRNNRKANRKAVKYLKDAISDAVFYRLMEYVCYTNIIYDDSVRTLKAFKLLTAREYSANYKSKLKVILINSPYRDACFYHLKEMVLGDDDKKKMYHDKIIKDYNEYRKGMLEK